MMRRIAISISKSPLEWFLVRQKRNPELFACKTPTTADWRRVIYPSLQPCCRRAVSYSECKHYLRSCHVFCPDGFLTSSLRLYLLTFHIFVWNKGTWTRRPNKVFPCVVITKGSCRLPVNILCKTCVTTHLTKIAAFLRRRRPGSSLDPPSASACANEPGLWGLRSVCSWSGCCKMGPPLVNVSMQTDR